MKYGVIELKGAYRETGPLSSSATEILNPSSGFRFDQFLILIEQILKNSGTQRVIVHHFQDFKPVIFAGAEALRSQLQRLVLAGKEVVFVTKQYDLVSLYLASACNRRVLHPLGTQAVLGLGRTFTFLKHLLDKQGIQAEVIRAGKYKSAGDRFRSDSLDTHNREQYELFFDAIIQEAREKITLGCGKTNQDFDDLLSGTVLTADKALAQGWIHEIGTFEDLIDSWTKEKYKALKPSKPKTSYGTGKTLAVLEFEGGIKDGGHAKDPLMGQMVGSDSYVKTIKEIAKNKKVKGVVLRIQSGGGSATASEDISRELLRLAEKKPVVVSMADVAGSGGYWISLGLSRVFAQRTSLTGSIGVIGILFSVKDFLKHHGITSDEIHRGEFANLGSPVKHIKKKEIKLVNGSVQVMYHQFIEKVASARRRTADEIHELAQGRVYSGEHALAKGLIDDLGGLTDALDWIKNELRLSTCRVEFFPQRKRSLLEKLAGRSQVTLEGFSSVVTSGILGTSFHEASSFQGYLSSGQIPKSFLVDQGALPLVLMDLF